MSMAIAVRRTSPLYRALPALVLGVLLLLGVVFHAEAVSAVAVWMGSTAYNHCFLILPIAAWLAWHRRSLLTGVPLQPTIVALPAAIGIGIVWFAADRLGVMVGRQLAVIAFVQLLFFSVLGWPLYRALAVPLLYLFFLVPFGGFLLPLLRSFTTHFVVHGLDLIGIPNFNNGNIIEIPQGTFYIAEACAGLRFLSAAVAFGVLYACVIYRGSLRRLIFMVASVLVPVIANGLRCLGTIWLGHVLGSATAAAADHVLYGYVFFSIVLLLIILLGLAFREDTSRRVAKESQAPQRAPARAARSFLPAGAVVVLAAIFPLLVLGIDRAAAATPPLVPVAFPGCVAAPTEAIPSQLASAGVILRRFSCRGGTVTLDLAVFSPRANPRRVVDAERLLSGRDTREADAGTLTVANAVPARWQRVLVKSPPAATASTLWFDGEPAPNDLRTRIHQALNSLFGGRTFPLVVSLRVAGPPQEAVPKLTAFLRSGGVPPEVLARVASGQASPGS